MDHLACAGSEAPVVVLVGHGSREAGANFAFEGLVARYGEATGRRAVPAYVELAQPLLDAALHAAARMSSRVVVAPVLLFTAPHVKNDIPLALSRARRQHPRVQFVAAEPLGLHPAMLNAFWQRIAPQLTSPAEPTTLVVVGRGASDPDANADLYKLARLTAEGRPISSFEPCFAGIAKPSFEDALQRAIRGRPKRVVVAPYLLFAGRIFDKLREQLAAVVQAAPWIDFALCDPIGAQPEVLRALEERIENALSGASPLPCDTCQYRTPIGAIADGVGGLKALLYSVRHGVTHGQAAPHAHAHRPLKKHVLVCGNGDCVERGSMAVLSALRRRLKQVHLERDIRVTRTGCMGRCGEGPAVVVYPDGIWYRGVREQDTPELIAEHLQGDRILARLVDNIMA
ncbi:MAG: CbiX/SirB N-terminal domain-containing protein [Myxococcales bacterium]